MFIIKKRAENVSYQVVYEPFAKESKRRCKFHLATEIFGKLNRTMISTICGLV